MRVGSFEFSLRELAGSMGDFGTLFPLAIGYIVVCGMNPAGFLVMRGLTNIALGLIYKLPMPVQPKEVDDPFNQSHRPETLNQSSEILNADPTF
jgi:hypothetical protein